MNFKVAFKVLTLLIALSATVYSMYLLNSSHTSDFMTSLGFGSQSQSLNWCSNRMTKMMGAVPELPWILEEKDQQWMFSGGGEPPKRMEYLDIEKWLAKYCILKIEIYRGDDMLDFKLQPFAFVTFNDGQVAKIYRLGEDIFQINEVTFKSKEFEDAVKELKDLLKI